MCFEVDTPQKIASYSGGVLIDDLIQTWRDNPSQRLYPSPDLRLEWIARLLI